MPIKKIFSILIIILILSMNAYAQGNQRPLDYLDVPGPILFQNNSYNLHWSAHPTSSFYKQEYLLKGDLVDKYRSMILIDVITGRDDISNIVGAKVEELKYLKASNPIVSYETFDDPVSGEYLIDFLLTANSPDEKSISVIERNVYRYKTLTGSAGQKAVLLFGISMRAYGPGVSNFLASFKSNKKDLVAAFSAAEVPNVTIK